MRVIGMANKAVKIFGVVSFVHSKLSIAAPIKGPYKLGVLASHLLVRLRENIP